MIEEIKSREVLRKLFNEYKNEYNPIDNDYTFVCAYKLDNTYVGFLIYTLLYENAEIIDIYVNPNYRRRGIARSLLNEVINNKEIKNITLEVNINNKSAIMLYNSLGFKEVSIRKGYYNGVDALLMLKENDSMKDVYILGIESSCDETSVSIVKNGSEEIITKTLSQIDIHKKFGGVVPEIASRSHAECITIVIDEALKESGFTMDKIDAIAVTYGPGLAGSLLVGVEAAKTLSLCFNKPLIGVNHMAGHIYANNLVNKMSFPLICLVISGGHTEIIYMNKDLSFKKIGGTLDDSVGEAFDKVARVIDVPYPGGPVIDKLSKIGNPSYNLPVPLDDDSYNFSFSGVKSAVINLVHNEKQRGNDINKEDLSTSFEDIVIKTLTTKTMRAVKEYNVKNLMLAGGVSANSGIREAFDELCKKDNINLSVPKLAYCTDNAAMIAAAGYFYYLDNRFSDYSLKINPSLDLDYEK